MGHKVTVVRNNTELPNGLQYQAGQSAVLSDEEYAQISGTVFTSGALTDGGAYPPVQGFTVNSPAQVLNNLNQLGNSQAQARSSFDRIDINADIAIAASGVALGVAVPLYAGDVVTKIAVKSGATAAVTPTHYFFALYNAAGTLIAQTADQLTAAWAANTTVSLSLSAPYTVTSTGVYYVAISVTAGTVPTVLGSNLALAGASAGLVAGQAVLAESFGSAVAGTAPATIVTPTAVANVPYVLVY